MSIPIKIGSNIIDFPATGASPVWSDAVIEFAQNVEEALKAVFGPYDVAPQILVIDTPADTPAFVTIDNLNFPPTVVLQFIVKYAVTRTTTLESVAETGTLTALYNPANPMGSKWEVVREAVGDSKITFYVTDNGQVQYDTDLLTGTTHTGKLIFSANALLKELV